MDKSSELENLKKRMQKDKSLPLREGATNLVFGEGDPDAKVMFIGEGPGFLEDKKGRPFVGNAGALLNHLLQSIKLPREKVFITNIVHYRPPENRDPEATEISAFQPYLDQMIKLIKPKLIVTLGRFSMAKFIPGVTISRVHGKKISLVWDGREIVVIPMYHPAAGLRRPEIKEELEKDFRKIPEVLKDLEEKDKEKQVEQMKLV